MPDSIQFPVRVVVVDDEPITTTIIQQALKNRSDIELVGTGQNGREALQLANRLRPDVIVLDINMPIFNGIEAAARITASFPSIGVLMLTSEESTEFVKSALRAGAREYLSKSDEILKIPDAIIRAAMSRNRNAPDRGLAFLWAFYGSKGTAGTTTLAVNTAAYLAQLHYRVLLLDLDMMHGDCGFYLKQRPLPADRNILYNLDDVEQIKAELLRESIQKVRLGAAPDAPVLDLLESPCGLVSMGDRSEEGLNMIMDLVMGEYDYVVVDVPPGRILDQTYALMLDMSERLFFVHNRDMSSLRAVMDVLKILARTSFSMGRLTLLFTQLLEAGLNYRAFIDQTKWPVRGLVDVPSDLAVCNQALREGIPATVLQEKSDLAVFVRGMVEEALNLPPQHGTKSKGWQSLMSNLRRMLGTP